MESGEKMTSVACAYVMNHSVAGMILKDRGKTPAAVLIRGHALKK